MTIRFPGGYNHRPVGDDLAPGPDPLADLVRAATSAVIRSRQMKSNGPGLVQKMHYELIDEGTL
jgi:hypothetical protein